MRCRDYCSIFNTLGTDSSATIAYAPGSEHHYPTMSTIWVHGGRLEIYIEREKFI